MYWENNTVLSGFKRNVVQANVATQLYRTRQEIDIPDVQNIFVPYYLTQLLAGNQNDIFTFKTTALPKSSTLQDKIYHLRNGSLMYTDTGYKNIGVVYVQNNAETLEELINNMRQYEYVELDYTSALIMHPYHNVRVLFNTASNGLLVLTNSLTIEFILKLGAILPLVYNYAVEPAFTEAFLNLNEHLFVKTFTDIYQDYQANASRRQIEKALNECPGMMSGVIVNGVREKIEKVNRAINDYELRIEQQTRELNTLMIQEASTYWSDQENGVTEFMQYLKDYCIEDIVELSAYRSGGNEVILEVLHKTDMLYWDEEQYEMYINSPLSNMFKDLNPQQRHLCNSIFKTRDVIVRMCTDVRLNLVTGAANRGTSFASTERYATENGFSNPHIASYDCWGNNSTLIKHAIRKKEYIRAWEQVKATMSGLNLADTTVSTRFINSYLFGSTYKKLPLLRLRTTGEVISVEEFMNRYPNGYSDTPVTTGPEPVVVEPEVVHTQPQPVPAVQEVIDILYDDDDDDDDYEDEAMPWT